MTRLCRVRCWLHALPCRLRGGRGSISAITCLRGTHVQFTCLPVLMPCCLPSLLCNAPERWQRPRYLLSCPHMPFLRWWLVDGCALQAGTRPAPTCVIATSPWLLPFLAGAVAPTRACGDLISLPHVLLCATLQTRRGRQCVSSSFRGGRHSIPSAGYHIARCRTDAVAAPCFPHTFPARLEATTMTGRKNGPVIFSPVRLCTLIFRPAWWAGDGNLYHLKIKRWLSSVCRRTYARHLSHYTHTHCTATAAGAEKRK